MLLQEPWARLVAEGVFPVLLRSMSTTVRGQVAVVARGVDERALVDGHEPDSKMFPQPALVGYVEIVNCLRIARRNVGPVLRRHFGRAFQEFYPKHYIPAQGPIFFWVLGSPKLLIHPKKVELPHGRRVWIWL